jgi:hypothetical protein
LIVETIVPLEARPFEKYDSAVQLKSFFLNRAREFFIFPKHCSTDEPILNSKHVLLEFPCSQINCPSVTVTQCLPTWALDDDSVDQGELIVGPKVQKPCLSGSLIKLKFGWRFCPFEATFAPCTGWLRGLALGRSNQRYYEDEQEN